MKLNVFWNYRSQSQPYLLSLPNPCSQSCRILAPVPNVDNPNGCLGDVIDKIVVLVDRDGTINTLTV